VPHDWLRQGPTPPPPDPSVAPPRTAASTAVGNVAAPSPEAGPTASQGADAVPPARAAAVDPAPAPPPAASPARPDGEAPASPWPAYHLPKPGAAGGPGAVPARPSALARLRLWTETVSPEDDQDRELIAQIRRRVFDMIQEAQESGRPESEWRPAAETRARAIAEEMARTLNDPRRQERVAADALSTLFGRMGPLEELMRDPTVSEILVNAPDEVFVEQEGQLRIAPVRFRADRDVRTLIEGIAAREGQRFDNASPILDCPLPDGSRLAAVRWPIAKRGTAVSIRKFTTMPSLADMIRTGAIPSIHGAERPSFTRPRVFPVGADTPEFLRWVFRERLHMVVVGSTSAGKTSLVNALMEYIDRNLRVIVIEDTLELQPPADLHVLRLERRPPNVQGQGEVPLEALLKAALRLRPDIIVVGECRKQETAVMLEAMSTGHDGSLTTVHADSPREGLRRLARLIREVKPMMPREEIYEDLAATIKVVVQMRRDLSPSARGRRLIERIAAIEGVEGGDFAVRDLYHWTPEGFRPTGCVPRWAERGE